MNVYKALNEITKYIEDNLENKINYSTLATFMGVNSYTMQRIFSLITGITITEYIRKRRMTCAGYDLYTKKEKIIDLAFKYQYNSPISFSRAFTLFHGIKPSSVNKFTKLKNYPRLIFDENINITNEIEYEIIELDEMNLYGISVSTNNERISNDAPKFFKESKLKYGDIKYAMTTYHDNTRLKCKSYYVLYERNIESFKKITIPKSKWLSFRINSYEEKEIQKMIKRFYKEFLPSCKYNLKNMPELEYYHDGVTDFLVPIY